MGNFADVHKHITLMMLLQSLKKKDSAFCYIDTHAGTALYDLDSRFARKNREFATGIGRLWETTDTPPVVSAYLDMVSRVNPYFQRDQSGLRYYPGSPLIARQLIRPQDRIILMELHNTEAPILKRHFEGDKQVHVHHRDGFEGLSGLVPPDEKRGLILIDPAYEVKDEFERLTDVVIDTWNKWPTGIYAIWYPLQAKQPIPKFHSDLRKTNIRRIFIHEFTVLPDMESNRLSGAGMLIINPPWQFDAAIAEVLDWLVIMLNRGSDTPARCEWLVTE